MAEQGLTCEEGQGKKGARVARWPRPGWGGGSGGTASGGPATNKGAKRKIMEWGVASHCHSSTTNSQRKIEEERGLSPRGGNDEDAVGAASFHSKMGRIV